MENLSIHRQSDDLTRKSWRFWYWDQRHRLILDYYSTQTRKTTRHKWREVERESYQRVSFHRSFYNMDAADVPLPQDVIDEAKAIFLETLTVAKEQR
jgi:hypothetical protein